MGLWGGGCGWTHATHLRWPGSGEGAAVKAGELRAESWAGDSVCGTPERHCWSPVILHCWRQFVSGFLLPKAAYLSCLCYPSVAYWGLSMDKSSTRAKQDYNASCTQCVSAKFMVPCNLRWSYSNLDPLELVFPYAVRFPEDKALLTWESFTGYMDKVKLV